MAKLLYEWCLEELDEYGDVIDSNFSQSLRNFQASDNAALVLIRYDYATDGITEQDRGYAYVRDGELPTLFDNGYNVPKRFHKELKK